MKSLQDWGRNVPRPVAAFRVGLGVGQGGTIVVECCTTPLLLMVIGSFHSQLSPGHPSAGLLGADSSLYGSSGDGSRSDYPANMQDLQPMYAVDGKIPANVQDFTSSGLAGVVMWAKILHFCSIFDKSSTFTDLILHICRICGAPFRFPSRSGNRWRSPPVTGPPIVPILFLRRSPHPVAAFRGGSGVRKGRSPTLLMMSCIVQTALLVMSSFHT